MPRTRDEARVEAARVLASQGKTQAQVAAELGVSVRTLRTWGIEWPAPGGRPRVSDESASVRTERRRRTGK
jgi:transposase-like protein